MAIITLVRYKTFLSYWNKKEEREKNTAPY